MDSSLANRTKEVLLENPLVRYPAPEPSPAHGVDTWMLSCRPGARRDRWSFPDWRSLFPYRPPWRRTNSWPTGSWPLPIAHESGTGAASTRTTLQIGGWNETETSRLRARCLWSVTAGCRAVRRGRGRADRKHLFSCQASVLPVYILK